MTPPHSRSIDAAAGASGAWTDPELVNPHLSASKADKVRGMFAAIAPWYDLNNRLHSLGRDQAWRRFAVKRADVCTGDAVLDVACGTGDLTEAFARTAAACVVGADFTPRMLEFAREKQKRLPAEQNAKLRYVQGDAMNLDFGDGAFDVVSIAFGIRNVADPAKAIGEFYRVLKPGGRLVVLEFDRPAFAPVRWFNTLYSGVIMPRTATWISGDKSGAYRYLPKSVDTFFSRDRMLGTITDAGFGDASATPLTMGICACYRAVKPGAA